MQLIPAIDLQDGECVRLFQGKQDQSTRYSDDPVGMAQHWVQEGAQRLHLVDLDGAFEEPSENKDVIQSIIESVSVPCQVGGGLRSVQAVDQLLEAGADAAIVGTAGIKNPDLLGDLVDRFGPESIIAGVDCRDGKVLVRGWEEASQYDRDEWLHRLEDLGVRRIVYTEVQRDGTEEGPAVDETKTVAETFDLEVVASGGVGTLRHLRDLKAIGTSNLVGVIVGRALYENNFTLDEGRSALT
jgi:phosphoribosylformimino-5-aminoimidazole carboxamide ribotide isomerase